MKAHVLLHFSVDEAPVDLSKVEAETYWDLFPTKDARQLRRLVLISAVVLASTLLMAPWSRGATIATPPGLPLFQFVNSGTGPLPWNAASLEGALNNTNMLGGPHGASDATEGALAYRTTSSDVALYTRNVDGTTSWADLSANSDAPVPGADPVPFFDPSGSADVLYVSNLGHLIVLSKNDPVTPRWHNLRRDSAWRPLIATDLSALTGVTAANGIASIQVIGQNALVAVRTLSNNIETFPLTWDSGQPVPYLSGPAVNVSLATASSTAASDPTVLATPTPALVTTSLNGDVELYAATGTGANPWVLQDLTTTTSGAKVTGTLATAATATTVYVTGLGANGSVELFSTPASTLASPAQSGTLTPSSPWTAFNVTAATTGAPPLSGSIFMDATPSQLTIAGPAANWGDLFAFTNVAPATTWGATDVSVTAGRSARTVGGVVTGFHVGTSLDLFAAGINSPPLQGVGVYAIPSSKWGQAITDGWPIISETGALGTQSAPWVGFTSAKSVTASPDFLIGQSIYNSHKRVTWLSFWTVSGPMATEVRKPTTYFNHGFAAGAWVATQIDQYRGLGVGLKPDWVIFDPEGYPDNHSGLDAPGGSSPATIALYASYWAAMLQGWAQGLASVDPSLNAGVYTSQSEFRNYSIAAQPLPVFMAVAFGGGGPIPVPGASGSNVRGFIAFSAVCSPTASLKAQEATLLNPPWAGQFNTLQFNAGVYCHP